MKKSFFILLPLLLVACSNTSSSAPPSPTPSSSNQQIVSSQGVNIAIPKAWMVVQRAKAPCGIGGPGIEIGPPAANAGIYQCPYISPQGTIIIFSPLTPQTLTSPFLPPGPVATTINKLPVQIWAGPEAMQSVFVDKKFIKEFAYHEVIVIPVRNLYIDINAIALTSTNAKQIATTIADTIMASTT